MMKRIFFLFCLIFTIQVNAQVFKNGRVLAPGKVMLGANPLFYNNSKDLGMFFHGRVGLKSGVDANVRYGFFDGEDYAGIDLDWRLFAGDISLTLKTGGHVWGDFAFDIGAQFSIALRSDAFLFTGIDADILFPRTNGIHLQTWLPVGVELRMNKSFSFILEGDIALNTSTNHIFGGGMGLYF